MLTINTNLSSIIAQNSLNKSTNSLNLAIERMSTGFKVNHSKDNAANYSITTNMSAQISSYNVAEDNCAMGLDMLTTANGGLDLIHSKLQRLRDLALQSANDTYGSDSQKAINAEAKAIVDEVKRVYNTAEYNGKKLFTDETANTAGLTTPTYSSQEVASMKTLTKAIEESSLTTGGEYSISSAEELAKLAEIVNSGTNTSGMTFVLANDIDLAQWCEAHADTGGWVAIGEYVDNSWNYTSKAFKGTFDGNGHVIENLTINNPDSINSKGLFGLTNNATIKNVGLENVNVHGNKNVGSLVGINYNNSTISNCYATGNVQGEGRIVGGLSGSNDESSEIINCYAEVETSGSDLYVGGLVGFNGYTSIITNSYATGDVNSLGEQAGGLVGCNFGQSIINNCYATGNVYSEDGYTGGLVGRNYGSAVISNSYATGYVNSSGRNTGGLVGLCYNASIITSYATGKVQGEGQSTGGLVGCSADNSIITMSYATGKVQGEGQYTGGLVGFNQSASTISDSYALGYVSGTDRVGSLVGGNNVADSITNCASLVDNKVGWSTDNTGDVLTIEEIRARYTDEAMGFTEENGWVAINGKQYVKGLIPAGVVQNTSLQIGINSDSNSQIEFNMGFALDGIEKFSGIGIYLDRDYVSDIDKLIETVSAKQTKFGSIQNRLESVLDEVTISRDNLVSSHSTLKDADIAKVSSDYIRHQILQQASATLLSTANQTPSIALQLI